MNKKILIVLLAIAGATIIAGAMPASVKAITIEEIKVQIANLQTQITQLLAQLAEQGGSVATPWCHNFNTNLSIDNKGGDVKALQEALVKDGSMNPPDNTVGFGVFNEYIASAVVGFQEKYASEILKPYGLSHGTGYVGKSTRAKLNKIYGCGNGNGGGGGERACTKEAKLCPDGSYVSRIGPNCEFAQCPSMSCVTEAGQGGTESTSKLTSCCAGLNKVDRSGIFEGICDNASGQSIDQWFTCIKCGNGVCGKGENSCNCPSDCKTIENLPPVIDGVTAPTQLKVNEQGVWQIKAHDPENGSLTYSVDWGDSSVGGSGGVLAPTVLKEDIQTSTFTHSYSKAGIYTVTFTIADDKNKSVQTSATVNVIEQLETFSWNLEKGNNLISFPIKPISNKIVDILKPIEGKYNKVSLWDETGKKWFVFSATSADFTLIEFNKSYIISMKEPATLTIQGTKWNKTLTEWMNSFNFVYGWNALGYPFTEATPMQGFRVSKPLQNILDYSPSEGRFIAAYWKLYLTAHSAVTVPDSQKTTLFTPGKGYMASSYDCSITVEGFTNICKQLCAEGYTSECNADGSNASYLKGECYCAGP